MSKVYTVGSIDYEFPDNFSDDQVKQILTKKGIIHPPSPTTPSLAGTGPLRPGQDRYQTPSSQAGGDIPFSTPIATGKQASDVAKGTMSAMSASSVVPAGVGLVGAISAGKATPFLIKAARDLAIGAGLDQGTSAVLKKIGVNPTIANVIGAIAGIGGAGTLESKLGRETSEELAYKLYQERMGTTPISAAEKLQAKGMAQAAITAGRKPPVTQAPEPSTLGPNSTQNPAIRSGATWTGTPPPNPSGTNVIPGPPGTIPGSGTNATNPVPIPPPAPPVNAGTSGTLPASTPFTGKSTLVPSGGYQLGGRATPVTSIPESPVSSPKVTSKVTPPPESVKTPPSTSPGAQETPNTPSPQNEYDAIGEKAKQNTMQDLQSKELLWSEHLANKGIAPRDVRGATNDQMDAWRKEINSTYGKDHRLPKTVSNLEAQKERIAKMMEGTWGAGDDPKTQLIKDLGNPISGESSESPVESTVTPPPTSVTPLSPLPGETTMPKTESPSASSGRVKSTPVRKVQVQELATNKSFNAGGTERFGDIRPGDSVTYIRSEPSATGRLHVIRADRTGSEYYLSDDQLKNIGGKVPPQ